jgi:hypothetical protein
MRKLAWLVTMTGLAVGAMATAAPNVPGELSVQGVLRDSQGRLQSKSSTVVAGLWDDPTAGTNIVTYSVFSNVPVVNGLFTIKIVDASLVAHIGGHAITGLWLELTVDGDTYPRQKIEPEAFSIMSLQADALSSACSGCVVDSMIGGVAFSKITGTVNAAQLNGKADTAFEPALSGAGCASPNFVQSITAGGVVTCSPAVNAVSIGTASSGLTAVTTSGSVSITVAPGNSSVLQHSLTGFNVNSQSESGATGGQFCPAGKAVSGVLGDGFFDCVNTVDNASNATTADGLSSACAGGGGCITTNQIQNGQVTTGKLATGAISIGASDLNGLLSVGTAAAASHAGQATCSTVGSSEVVCQSCFGAPVVGGTCWVTGVATSPAFSYSGPAPIPNPSPNPSPAPLFSSDAWCCVLNDFNIPCQPHQIHAQPICISFSGTFSKP